MPRAKARVIVAIDEATSYYPAMDVYYVTAIRPEVVTYDDNPKGAMVFNSGVIYDRIRELRKDYPHMGFAAMPKP